MTDTTAKIRAKGCETTGLTEEIARKLHDGKPGKRLMAVVELEYVLPHGPDKEGKRAVDLIISQIEPAPTAQTEAHLRELTRSFHYERKLTEANTDELPLGDDEPRVAEVLAAGRALEPHQFEPSDLPGEENKCDVCGRNPLESIHQDLDDQDKDDELDEDEQDPDAAA